jgi:hypothetical protein
MMSDDEENARIQINVQSDRLCSCFVMIMVAKEKEMGGDNSVH